MTDTDIQQGQTDGQHPESNAGTSANPAAAGEVAELQTEPPFVPKPNPFIPSSEVADKLQKLVTQKKEEQAERERLASMPKQPFVREEPRVGRNDPCPCGSGKKYKKCCMK